MTRIAVDPARTLGTLDRKVFGGFVEHLGRCVYGGLYDEGSPLADARAGREAGAAGRRYGCGACLPRQGPALR